MVSSKPCLLPILVLIDYREHDVLAFKTSEDPQ